MRAAFFIMLQILAECPHSGGDCRNGLIVMVNAVKEARTARQRKP
jgi:hypothetical protein